MRTSPPVLQDHDEGVLTMMVNTYPNDIDDALSRRQIPAPLHTVFLTGKKSLFCYKQNGKQMVKYRIGFYCRPNLKYFNAQNG